jgi:hypothetical protein
MRPCHARQLRGRVWQPCCNSSRLERVKISLSTTSVEGLIMRSDLVFYAFTFIVLIFLVFCCSRLRRSGQSAPAAPQSPRPKREPKPFAGLTHKPACDVCSGICTSLAGAWRAATPDDVHSRLSAPGRDHRPLLPGCHLFISRLGRLWQYSRQWSSQWPPLATTRVWAATAISWKPWARRFTPSRATPISWCGPSRLWLKDSASARWLGSSRPIPIRYGAGSSRQLSTWSLLPLSLA